MTTTAIFWLAMTVVVCIILPAFMAMSVRQHLRARKHGESDKRSAGGGAIGNALQELDRLVARPSVEYTIEAETPLRKRDDDQGGE